jgi:RNA polymerase sigma factor (sigma-70 family)
MEGDEFLHRVGAKDPTVWDDLMPELRSVALGACRDLRVFDQLRDDVVQDVALRVFRKWDSFKSGARLNTWIYSIARNSCIDALRKIQVRREFVVGNDLSADGGLESEPAGFEGRVDESQSDMLHRLCVQQVLAELEDEGIAREGSQRKIEVIKFWVEHQPTNQELADFLGTTLEAARVRKSYIVRHLRALCRKYCGDDHCALTRQGGQHGVA